jgi:hypothetical protein
MYLPASEAGCLLFHRADGLKIPIVCMGGRGEFAHNVPNQRHSAEFLLKLISNPEFDIPMKYAG